MDACDELIELFHLRGQLAYDGEDINQIEHAWQCGQLAREAGVSPELQLAAWLHDAGHLMTDLIGSPTVQGVDDRHEHLAAQALQPWLGAAVVEPIRWHVEAKRYLVTRRASYRQKLSPDSLRSLALQGGPMSDAECRHFEGQPWFEEALLVRAWDDAGKRPGWFAPSVYMALEELRKLVHEVHLRR